MRRHHELPFGAELTADGVRFRLWAPRAKDIALLLEDPQRPAVPMVAEADGWFSLTSEEAGPGSRYRYRVDGAGYPDPASRHQPDGVHGISEVIDPGAYEWRDGAWRGRPWHELVIYELHLGTFSESGDFTGAIAHLDHLVSLGVTHLELLPVAEELVRV
jgi:1,4-alpha-glucan branching enzyme